MKKANKRGRPAKSEYQETYLNVPVSPAEHALILAKAKEWTNGNIRNWVRFAALHFEPKPEHMARND